MAGILGDRMNHLPGTYALVLSSSSDRRIRIGKFGLLHIRPGFYIYVGSAFGPGGLGARIAHHRKIHAKFSDHDYIFIETITT
jgi:Uri superfamily endonuclease